METAADRQWTKKQKRKEKHMNTKAESMGAVKEIAALGSADKHSGVSRIVAVVLAMWFGVVFLLGIKGAFVGAPGSPPLPIFLGFAIPMAAFFAAYFRWKAFRAFVLGADLRLLAGIQAWREAGFGFLALYAHGVLPGLFAFPAGLGDMAVGITAPWIVLGLIRQPSFAISRRFVMWNILGITDLAVAVSMGAICSGFLRGLTGSVTTGAMAQLPLVFIPAYMVPLFLMLHFTALFQVRQLARSAKLSPSPNN
jgi:hypothetical protein